MDKNEKHGVIIMRTVRWREQWRKILRASLCARAVRVYGEKPGKCAVGSGGSLPYMFWFT